MQLIFEQYHPTKDRQNVQVIYYLCMAYLLRHKSRYERLVFHIF